MVSEAEKNPGRLATPEEARNAWAEVDALLLTIKPWNIPKAAEYIRGMIKKKQLSAEAIALGFFATKMIDEHQRRELGKLTGAKSRGPRKRPDDFHHDMLVARYDKLEKDNAPADAYRELARQIAKEHEVDRRTARNWLNEAGITRAGCDGKFRQRN
jgi:hypothetical protein